MSNVTGKIIALGGGGGASEAEVEELRSAITELEYEVESLDPIDPPETISWINNTWINSSGVAETDNNYEATDYIDLTDVVAISYTGKMGSSRVCFWYNSSKTFLSYSLQLSDRMAWYENVMIYKPEGAKYLRLQSKKTTASNPPSITPEVTVFKDANFIDHLREGIVGDGVTDDTLAVQKIVNMSESVTFPRRDQILITAPIDIRLGYSRVIDGNGCGIIVDDDFYALSVTGTLDTSSDATNMDAFVVKNEADCIIKNFRITAETTTEGGGIEATKAFKLKLQNNYIHHMKNGIRLYGRLRDVIISENNIFAHTNAGLLFDSGVNLHQCNINNNMLQYAHDVILIDEPYAIANFQIVGNDIEIDQFPASTYSTAKCIYMKSVSTNDQFSEIEITGNTIQGHDTSTYLVVLEGVASHEIKHVAINGNHFSNTKDSSINMKNVKNITITGNNHAVVRHYAFELDGTCENILICGEGGIDVKRFNDEAGGKLHAASTATLTNVKAKEILFTPGDGCSIETSNVTNVDVYDEKDIPVTGSTPTIVAVPNARYICGEVSSLNFTPCASGVCEVVFTSGSTAATLTIPNTVKWSDSFDPTSLDTSTTYEISVLNGTMGVCAKWA